MAAKAEINTVYAAGLIQGIALVTFPAASTIFTSPSQYGLSNTQYGTMFLPQVVTAITGSLLAFSAVLFDAKVLNATTQTIMWVVIFFASAGASAAYLTVSET